MSDVMCFYICVTVVIVAVLIAVCFLVFMSISHKDFDEHYNSDFIRMQRQCDEMYQFYTEKEKSKKNK